MELNEHSEWQDAIDFTKQHNKRYRDECRRQRMELKRKAHRAVDCALVGAMAIALCVMGLMNPYVTAAVFAISFIVSIFTLGRLFEQIK